jgi:hypothetical protein
MPFCTLAGITVPCRADATQEDAAVKTGYQGRSFDNTLRSTVYARKRQWTLQTAKIPLTVINSLVSACDSGQTVTMNGDIVAGVGVSVKVTIGARPWHIAIAPYWQSCTITVFEI